MCYGSNIVCLFYDKAFSLFPFFRKKGTSTNSTEIDDQNTSMFVSIYEYILLRVS